MAQSQLGWSIEAVKHWWTKFSRRYRLYSYDIQGLPKGFHVLPRRWVIMGHKAIFFWLMTNRRLGVDYERLTKTDEAFICMAMSRIMLRRLAKAVPD